MCSHVCVPTYVFTRITAQRESQEALNIVPVF